jgi:hypothetical protein
MHVLGDSSYDSSSSAEIVKKTFGEFLQDVYDTERKKALIGHSNCM